MKNEIVKIIVAASFLVLMGTVTSLAQVHNRLTANIPFSFIVKDQELPAGEYEIKSLNPASGQTALLFTKKGISTERLLITMNPLELQRSDLGSAPVLTFNRYGSVHYLSTVRNSAESFGAQVSTGRGEKDAEKQMGKPTRETIALSKQH